MDKDAGILQFPAKVSPPAGHCWQYCGLVQHYHPHLDCLLAQWGDTTVKELEENMTCLLQLTGHFAVQVTVVGQMLPVQMSIRLQLTSTHISCRPRSIEFGQCNLGENTGVQVQVTNHSLLPQKYGESNSIRTSFPPTPVWVAPCLCVRSTTQQTSLPKLTKSHLNLMV